MKMKHCYINIFIAFVVSMMFGACEIRTLDNGDLDGMWHLTRVDTLATSTTADLGNERIYWSFQARLLQLDDKSGMHQSLLMRFEHNGATLRLYDPYIYDRENGDKPLEDITLLNPFGIVAPDETYTIESLSGNKMILLLGTYRMYFKKL